MIRVLIVDDSPIIRSSLSKWVDESSDSIAVAGEAANGLAALEWLDSYHADICVTDVRMPRMDGLELIGAINERYPWMACIVVSSYDDFEYAKQSIQLEAVDYILKPVDANILHHALKKAALKLDKSRRQFAAHLFIKKTPFHRPWLERWLEQLRTRNVSTLPLLIVDTLEMLEEWVEGRYDLLNALSMTWLNMVIEELKIGKLNLALDFDEGEDIGLGEKRLPKDQLRSYYRLCAVRRLEEGAYFLIEKMNTVHDQQSVKLVEDIKAYIEQHYAKKLSLQEVADYVAISKNYMCGIFKQETSMTIGNYIVFVRMREARELLLSTSLKSYEIGLQVGYEDVIYFGLLFKKQYGFSPMDYKKRINQ